MFTELFSALTGLVIKFSTSTPRPIELNAENVNPGPIAGYVFGALTLALIVLLFSLNRHIKRINFIEEDNSK
jgi:hypothetical protein